MVRNSATAAARIGLAALGLVLVFGAAAGAADAPAAAGDPVKGKEVFQNFACGTCHVLADAGGSGPVGPALDGASSLTYAVIVDRVTNGQGAMPAFGGQLSEQEIADVSAYIMKAKQ